MKKRPLSIIVIALIYVFLPIGNLIQAAFINNLPFLGEDGLFHRILWSDWVILSLFPVAGVGIYMVRKWGWYFFVAFSFVLLSYGLPVHYFVDPTYSFETILLCILVITGMSAFFFRRHVYAPYFNPRLRWWEAAKRYKIRLDAEIFSDKSVYKCQVLDISVTGCFIDQDEGLAEGGRVWLRIKCNGMLIQCSGRVVRKASRKERHSGYGIMFRDLSKESKKNIKYLVRFLERLGYQDIEHVTPSTLIEEGSHPGKHGLIQEIGIRIKTSVKHAFGST